MSFLIKLKIVYLKIDVSCQASVHFHHISQNAMPATEFARCHHLTQPRQCDLQRTRSTTRLKCACRLPRKKTMEVSQKCNSSSENEKYCACHTKRLLTRYQTRLNVTKCHACHAKRSYATFGTSTSDSFCRTRDRHGHSDLSRTVANGCERKRDVERTHPQPPDPQSETGTLLRIREKHLASNNHGTRFSWLLTYVQVRMNRPPP